MEENREEMTIDEAFLALDAIVEALEGREITLEESFQKYQEGMGVWYSLYLMKKNPSLHLSARFAVYIAS